MDNNELKNKIIELENQINTIKNNKNFKLKTFLINSLTKKNNIIGIMIATVLTTIIVYAAQTTFVDGTIISADKVNSNFTELYNKCNNIAPIGTV